MVVSKTCCDKYCFSQIMKKKIIIFLLANSIFNLSYSQFELTSYVENKTHNEDYWETELSPLTNLIEILNYIHHDPYRSEFIKNIPAGYPLKQSININSFYGVRRHPVHQVLKFHKGIDLKGSTGEIAIATGDGIVLETGFKKDIGNYIKIQHKYGFQSIYGHLSKIKVKEGNKIEKNQIIGLVGATGTVTGPHLHYTVKKNDLYLDPFDFLFMEFKNDL
jgi:murein DD-endopeptidase MepM/ murein hydrolase activator NlpD